MVNPLYERLTQAVVFLCREIAFDRDALKEMCITHILNAAAQKKDLKYYLGTFNDEDIVGSVNTGSRYYRGLHINYYGLPTADRCCSDISEYFMPAAKFIDKALDKRASTLRHTHTHTHMLQVVCSLGMSFLTVFLFLFPQVRC